MRPPAEVEIGTDRGELRIEPGNRPEEVSAHHQACRRQFEDVLHEIVLLLVDLAVVGERHLHAEPVHRNADALDARRVLPMDQLRTDHPRIRPPHLLDECADRVGGEPHVVVEETEQATITLHEIQDRIAGRRIPGVAPEVAHHGVRDHGVDQVPGRLVGGIRRVPRHQEKELEARVVLVHQALQGLAEPVARLVDDHRGHHGRQGGGNWL